LLENELALINDQVAAFEQAAAGFEQVKKSIMGALLSPEETSASALAAFQSATGIGKAEAALNVQQALLAEFQAAQQAAANGLITQEELKAIQAATLQQLATVEAATKAQEDKLLDKQEAIQNAIEKLNQDEQAALNAQNKILESQLNELKNIKNALAGTPQFQSGGTVENTGLAYVHKGETVVPAGQSSAMLNISINGGAPGARDRETIARLVIDALRLNTSNLKQAIQKVSK
jgi:hypothetical protein